MVTLHLIRENERAELFEMVQRYWMELMPQAPVVKDPTRRLKYFEERFPLGSSKNYYWWAVLDGIKIGFANVELSKEYTGDTWASVGDFYIEPKWRRKGYGQALTQVLVNWMRGQSVYRIDLHVRSDNPVALAFWKSVGFDLASYRLRKYID